MGAAKKERKREKEKKEPDSDDDDDNDDEVEQEEEVESVHAKKKKEKSRKAFMGLCRQLLTFIPLAMVLSQQPLMMKPRQPGVNRAKLVPLQLAVHGVMEWAKSSPTTMRNPNINHYINVTARGLFTPYEWGKAQQSKRAMPNEQTWAGAWKKTKGALDRVAKGDAASNELTRAPFPNIPVIGSYLLTGCSLLAVLAAGAEYGVVIGCGMVLQGSRGFGMEPQPEMYVTGVVGVVGILLMDAANKKAKEPPKRKRR